MNTGHTLYPSYAMPPSPQPRQAADDLTLIALHTAIRFSGLFAKFTAQRWRLTHLAEAAEQVAKELIARAVETTGNPDPHPRYSDLGELHVIGIRVSVKDGGLLIEVWDSDPTPPQDAYLDSHLSTVEEISQQWDCYQPRSGGKVIRAELAVPRQRQANQQLPQRTAGHYSYPESDTPVTLMRDTQLMQDVLDGLHRFDTDVEYRSGQL